MARRQTYHLGRKALILALAGLLSLGWRRLRPFRVAVQGPSMIPGLVPGDFLVATAGSTPRRGDVVVVEHPGRPGFELVKRLSGVPGDTVDGHLLGPGEHWVVGDAPQGSTDSWAFGPVSGAAIRGVVRLRYWPPGRAGLVR